MRSPKHNCTSRRHNPLSVASARRLVDQRWSSGRPPEIHPQPQHWQGQAERLEDLVATLSDSLTCGQLVDPLRDFRSAALLDHGPAPTRAERFGPETIQTPATGMTWFDAASVQTARDVLTEHAITRMGSVLEETQFADRSATPPTVSLCQNVS